MSLDVTGHPHEAKSGSQGPVNNSVIFHVFEFMRLRMLAENYKIFAVMARIGHDDP